MSYIVEKVIARPSFVLDKLPLSISLSKEVEQHRKEIFEIIEGKDKRKILIIGPCSAWPNKAVVEYAKRLQKINSQIKDKIKIIMRVYTQKPRTTIGWTGSMNQPDPLKNPDIDAGIIYCRKMMLDIIEIGLPIADEALFTHNEGYFNDLLCWIAIGARSAEDQEHRVFASIIDHPVGMKNPTSGNLTIAVNSVIAAQHPHVFLLLGKQVKSLGNMHAHLILRGGNGKSNLSKKELIEAKDILIKNNVRNPSIIVDMSHENSIIAGKKDYRHQSKMLFDVIESMKDKELGTIIKGFMIESFLLEGNQKASDEMNLNGLSITDPCLGIQETEKILLKLHQIL